MDKDQVHIWTHEMIDVPMTKNEILSVIGHILLAFKHPRNQGPTRGIVKELARRLAALIVDELPTLYEDPEPLLQEWRKEGLL